MNDKILRNEQGRSMVEMLGVLAIIAVLTVVGIAGFRQAITKHRANELLNEANKRAAVVAGQLSMMGAAQGTLSEFTQNEFAGGTFKTGQVSTQNGTFKIGIDHVLDDVCNQIQGMAGGIIIDITPCASGDDSTIFLAYNNDLTQGESGDNTVRVPRPEDGLLSDDGSTCTGERKGECQVCNQGAYIDSDAVCVAKGSGLCVDGVCKTLQASCMSNGDCPTINPNQCGNGECYCDFNNVADNCTGPRTSGVCKLKTSRLKQMVTKDGHTYIYGGTDSFDWWSARNFCAAYGKRMMTIAELGCENPAADGSCSDTNAIYVQLRSEIQQMSTFTSELAENCHVRYVRWNQQVTIWPRICEACNVICY